MNGLQKQLEMEVRARVEIEERLEKEIAARKRLEARFDALLASFGVLSTTT